MKRCIFVVVRLLREISISMHEIMTDPVQNVQERALREIVKNVNNASRVREYEISPLRVYHAISLIICLSFCTI